MVILTPPLYSLHVHSTTRTGSARATSEQAEEEKVQALCIVGFRGFRFRAGLGPKCRIAEGEGLLLGL